MSPSIQGFSSEKVVFSDSGGKYAQIKHRLQAKIVQNKYVSGFLMWETTGDLFTRGIVIMDYESDSLKSICKQVI